MASRERNAEGAAGQEWHNPAIERDTVSAGLLAWHGRRVAPGGQASGAGTDDHAVSPGLALNQLIAVMSARATAWEQARLQATAGSVRASGRGMDQDAYFYTQTRIMNIISHAIEERLIEDRRVGADVYAGFQRLALVGPQTPRYRALAEVVGHVYLYGINDESPTAESRALQSPNLFRFPITSEIGAGLEAFWFVVVDDPIFPTALVAQHTGGDLWARQQAAREYTGFWTFNPSVVAQVVSILQRGARMLYYSDSNA